jgi:hypothetical protein
LVTVRETSLVDAMKRAAVIGACLVVAFVLVNYLEFYYWFYNNEMPAYLRLGVLHGDASGPIRAFYEAAYAACPTQHPNLVEQCQGYQIALLGDGRYVRPLSTLGGIVVTALSTKYHLMQVIKIAIIGLAMGSAILCALLLSPFLARLEGRALLAIGLVWITGWIANRLLHIDGLNRGFAVTALAGAVVVLAAMSLPAPSLRAAAITARFRPEAWPAWGAAAKLGLQLVAIAVCFGLGYRLHVLHESHAPVLYLLLALGLWLLLGRALSERWIFAGVLSAVLYLSATLVLFFYDLAWPKQHQLYLAAIFLFIAIWRDDTRVYWAVPLLLLFDMQNGARLGALIVVGETLLVLWRRRIPVSVVPAILTAIVGVAVTRTAYYPFDDRLYSISDVIGVFLTPVVVMAGLAALAIVWAITDDRTRDAPSTIAVDRLLVYAASIVMMGGIQIATWGLFFDAFQLSTLYRSVAVAPAMAIFFVTAALLLTSCRPEVSDSQRQSAIASLAALGLLMTAAIGRPISWEQLREGVHASVGRYLPADWPRRTPMMSLDDNTVYVDGNNVITGPVMQFSMIKILLLSRSPEFSRDKLTVLIFGGRAR